MLTRLKLLSISIASGAILMLVLCLGAQNLNQRHTLKFGSAKTVPLPTGFVIGISIVLGIISGGSTAALLIPNQSVEDTER